MDSVNENGKKYFFWDQKAVMAVAGLFETMQEFRDAYIGAYKFATRHGFLDEVNDQITGESSPERLLDMLKSALDESSRRYSLARRIRSLGERQPGLEAVAEDGCGNHLDHDIGHWEQSAEEVEERALEYISRIKNFGTDADVALAWDMFYTHQLHGRNGKRSRVLTRVPHQEMSTDQGEF